MNRYKKIFTDYLDATGTKWIDVDEDSIRIVYGGENLSTIRVMLFFDSDHPTITAECWDIAKFKNKREVGISLCNDLNNEYRWVKFSIDGDDDVCCARSVYSPVEDPEIFGKLGFFAVQRIVALADTVYPRFMKALWG